MMDNPDQIQNDTLIAEAPPAKVLIVDDVPANLKILRDALRPEGYNILVAASGEDALRTASRSVPDLILLDVMMPGMNGFEVCRRIKDDDDIKHIPVIFLTALEDKSGLVEGFTAGGVDYVTKPFEKEEVLARIDTHLKVSRLSRALVQKNTELTETLNRLQEETDRREAADAALVETELRQMRKELDIAHRIQMAMLPQLDSGMQARTEFDIAARMETARAVGGDLYDFFLIDENRLGIVIGDVADKGIPAALFMAMCRTQLRSTALTGLAPHACLEQVNQLLSRDNDTMMFVSVFYGILDLRTGAFEYSIGGHPLPYLLKPKGENGIEQLEFTGDIVLGVMEHATYQSKQIELQPGDSVFLYTDGVSDAMDSSKQFYTDARLEALLLQVRGHTSDSIVQRVVDDVDRFASGVDQFDDITVLAITYKAGA
jgi:phosphoserine phosphatase RsbU/P